jgi:hypothetical protein
MLPRSWIVVIVALVIASCERSAERPASPASPASPPPTASSPPAPAPAPAITGSAGSASAPGASAPDPGDRIPQVHPSGSAADDFPSLKQELAWLARAADCVPQKEGLLELALDSYDGKLVLCAQGLTRRDVSVFFDEVSYACWNIDPATAAVTRRADLGRSYFQCQDGTCPMLTINRFVSHDGTKEVALAEGKAELSIFARPGGALIRSFAGPAALAGQELHRGNLILLGDTIFAVADQVHVLDSRGAVRGKLEGNHVHVVDAGHALVIQDHRRATLYELASGKSTPISLTARHLAGAIRHGGTFFAVDSDTRKLVTLDPKTLQPRRSIPLPLCKWPSPKSAVERMPMPPPPDE